MIYRRLDNNADYVFGGNKSNYVSDIQAVKQAIQTRLKLLVYEWWEDLEDGLPQWQSIVAKRDVGLAAQAIAERIQKTKHVKTITNLEVDWDNENRKFTFQATVDTEFGQVELRQGVI